jgi:Icc-related predicted phosphoesterase
VKILSISDTVVPVIYSPIICEKFADVDCVIGCGDLPYYYQEYIISSLNVPLYFVHGNHDPLVEYSEHGECAYPHGGISLHGKVVRWNGMLMAGVQGSVLYSNSSKYQYTQSQMWTHVFKLVPGLLWNRFVYGRYLDVFVTHASPWGIHDGPDYPHIGVKAFRWLLKTFKPSIHLHGHIHVYRPDTIIETTLGHTRVINTYGYQLTNLDVGRKAAS